MKMLDWIRPEYRIVSVAAWHKHHKVLGFSVEIRRWWHWPAWTIIRHLGSYHLVEDAESAAHHHAVGFVKYLGRIGSRSQDKPNG